MSKDFYTPGEVCELLDISPRTLARMVARGTLTPYQHDGRSRRRFPVKQIERKVEQMREASNA